MMSSLEDLLYGGDLGEEASAVELGGVQDRVEDSAASDNVSEVTSTFIQLSDIEVS